MALQADVARRAFREMTRKIIFSFTTFLAAFLLFWVQPLISKYILPWFGGTPAVWSTALLFFQSLLMAGYAYAHLQSKLSRRGLVIHCVFLGISLLALFLSALAWGVPLLPGSNWKPLDASLPLLRILVVLLASIGLPYFVLAATSPLLQTWYRLLLPGHSPFRLYALSNLGSFLALICYPFLLEPLLDLQQQSSLWSIAFMGYSALSAWLLFKVSRQPLRTDQPSLEQSARESHQARWIDPPTRQQKLVWILLPAISSMLLLSVTNQLTQEIAVIPFLWVLPLAVYLLSFTLTFAERNWYKPGWVVALLAISLLLLSFTLENFLTTGVIVQIIVYCFFLFLATFFLHGELYLRRPPDRQLTAFYLLISLGSVLGASFVNLAAPLVFNGFWELQLGMIACWVLVLVLLVGNRKSTYYQGENRLVIYAWLFVMGIISIVAFETYTSARFGTLFSQRNFYGITRVRRVIFNEAMPNAAPTSSDAREIESNMLSHGATTHGFQFLDPALRNVPTSYFAPSSGIGLTLTHYPKIAGKSSPTGGTKVGVIGLGIGTLAAYGKPGDAYRFYEINPTMIELAKGDGDYFTFLQDTPAEVEIISGDARLALERELEEKGSQAFDVLVMDAFSSDSIPVHLLTRQAFELYLQHLKAGGVLAINISNRYIDLAPMLYSLAEYYDLGIALIRSPEASPSSYPAIWTLLTHNEIFLTLPEITRAAEKPPDLSPGVRLWTDDYSNLLPYLMVSGSPGAP
jgi:hypothetical protein